MKHKATYSILWKVWYDTHANAQGTQKHKSRAGSRDLLLGDNAIDLEGLNNSKPAIWGKVSPAKHIQGDEIEGLCPPWHPLVPALGKSLVLTTQG